MRAFLKASIQPPDPILMTYTIRDWEFAMDTSRRPNNPTRRRSFSQSPTINCQKASKGSESVLDWLL
jgi:hypothetical protein